MDATEIQKAVERLEELVRKTDVETDHTKKHLLLRSKNLAATLLDPYVLFHTKIVVSLVRKKGGDRIDEAAAWLHDIGRAVVDEGHRDVGAIWARNWLKKFYITDEELERIIDGIEHHGTGDEPKTRTGKLLKLMDAMAVLDEGWVAMILKYYESIGKMEVGEEQIRKKAAVVRELGSAEDIEQLEKIERTFGVKI